MSIQETVLLGVISSIIASIVFYLLMILIKPKFIISHKMSKTPVDSEYTDYMIKVVNMTRTVITNVSYSLEYCIEGPDGIIEVHTIKPLKKPLLNMDKYCKHNTDYAIRITYRIKNEEYPLKDNTYFDFTFQAYHSFSNSLRIKKRRFVSDSVMEGIFETGKSTKILSRN
ncbi:MAG: hypothetical protein ACLVJ4_08475 [Mediterraneibacter sp.]